MKLPRRTAMLAVLVVTALGLSLAPATATVDRTLVMTDAFTTFSAQLITVHTPDRAAKDRLNNLGLDLTEHAGHDYIEMVAYSQSELDLLVAQGFTWDVRIEDMAARQNERIMLDAAFAEANPVTDLPSGQNAYRDLAEFGEEIDELVAAKPNIAKRISIGQSFEGRDLTGIEMGADVNEPEDGRPVFLMFGVHHAREWPSAEMPMEFAHDLVNGYGTDARITDLLDRGRVIIVPVSNPDGYNASRISGDIIDLNILGDNNTFWYNPVGIIATPGNAYKRKNCRYVDGVDASDGISCLAVPSPGGFGLGTDLNRNYGANWGGPGADANVPFATYRGAGPFSEPETQAIRTLISTRQVTTLLSNHTFSNLMLRPVGVQPNTIVADGFPAGFAPDECFTDSHGHDAGMQAIGEQFSAHVGYSNQYGWELYDTTGTTEDYSYNATGGYGYTPEIGRNEFHPPYEQVVEEYLGTSPSAEGVYLEGGRPVSSLPFSDRGGDRYNITNDAGDICEGDLPTYTDDDIGGGLQAAYLVALENAVNADTHSTITGSAPAGTEITVSRTGDFPLWDRSTVSDTVTTTMTTDSDGEFTYHVNPSTRPFVASRKLPDGSFTPGGVELWTVECNGLSTDVQVDRGHTVSVGDLCA